MSIEILFPSTKLTEGEIFDVMSHLSSPSVVKYLKSLAIEDSKELLSLGTLDMTDREVMLRHIFVSGKLAVTTTLLSIQSGASS